MTSRSSAMFHKILLLKRRWVQSFIDEWLKYSGYMLWARHCAVCNEWGAEWDKNYLRPERVCLLLGCATRSKYCRWALKEKGSENHEHFKWVNPFSYIRNPKACLSPGYIAVHPPSSEQKTPPGIHRPTKIVVRKVRWGLVLCGFLFSSRFPKVKVEP